MYEKLSRIEDEVAFFKKETESKKQKKNFVEKETHPTTTNPLGMKFGEIWFSDDGTSVNINYMAKNGTVYTLPLTATP